LVTALDNAAPRGLPGPDQGPRAKQVLRSKDFIELFDTDPDLSGYDIDISPFVRDADDTDVRLFWREGLDKDRQHEPPRTLPIDRSPNRVEFCAAPIAQVRDWLNRRRSRPRILRGTDCAGSRLAEPPSQPTDCSLCRRPEREAAMGAPRSGGSPAAARSGDPAR
jgi:CRISPR-associated endonuclease/helicase Cas3